MRFAAISDIGKVRKVNEDSFYIPESEDKIKLFLIADGIGGQNHGKLAGMMTVESVIRNIYKDSDNPDKKSMLNKAIKAANNILTIQDLILPNISFLLINEPQH